MKNFCGKTWFLSAVILVIGLFFVVKNAHAATSTVRGAAWWNDQYRYLYFDCLDDVTGDQLDVEGNLYAYPEPRGFHFYSTPCSNLVHHVSIDNNSNFSGSAWNYSKGLVSFDATETPPDGYGFNSKCPHTCNLSNNCWACYLESEQKVYGWMRVVSDGTWIKLDSAMTTPVKIQSWDYLNNSVLPGHGIEPGDFVGYATSTAGDLSFNCESEGGGSGNCATRDYKVYISSLQVGHLSAPNWSYGQACGDTALKAVLKWYTKSGTQAGYEVVVNDTDNLSTSTAVCWSGVKTPSIAAQYIIPNTDPYCLTLNYNTNYYWWIRLFYLEDSEYKPTEWYQYGVNDGHNGELDEQTSGDPDGNIKTFTTYKHEFPSPYFTWDPYDVLVGTTTDFTSNSQYYTSSNPTLPQSCSGSNCLYLWATTDPEALIGSSTNATTSIIFYHATGTGVSLNVTDADNYVCSTSTTLNINYDLPIWREVKAQ